MGVAAEVRDDLLGADKGALDVDMPWLAVEPGAQVLPSFTPHGHIHVTIRDLDSGFERAYDVEASGPVPERTRGPSVSRARGGQDVIATRLSRGGSEARDGAIQVSASGLRSPGPFESFSEETMRRNQAQIREPQFARGEELAEQRTERTRST